MDERGDFTGPIDIRVVDGVVASVGENLPSTGLVDLTYDLSGTWVLPGFIDCHAHVGISTTNEAESYRTPYSERVLETAVNLKKTLASGVTYLRDPGGGTDAGIRDSVTKGFTKGPRMQIAIAMLSQTGGHCDGFLEGPGIDMPSAYVLPDYPGRPPFLVDGCDEMRKTVRQLIRSGADWIKLCTTGGIMSEHDDWNVAEFTEDEVRTAVSEASGRNNGVCVHAFGGAGLDIAIDAGVRSVEHGLFITEEQAHRMAEQDIFLVPTLHAVSVAIDSAKAGLLPPTSREKALQVEPLLGEAVKVAREAGVKIAMGTDFVSRKWHGRNLREVALLHEAGLSVEESLIAGTSTGAELCDIDANHGSLVTGKIFDAVVLNEEPSDLWRLSTGSSIIGVIQSGSLKFSSPALMARCDNPCAVQGARESEEDER